MPRDSHFEQHKGRDLYGVLQVPAEADFATLKRAYYKRAKECHPDLHGQSSERESEFKLLVAAFDILSDTHKRKAYDEHLEMQRVMASENQTQAEETFQAPIDERDRVMDSVADDILEEVIVGNYLPHDARLQSLMQDLERTDRFIRFREAKDHFYAGRVKAAYQLLRIATANSPTNILYHYYSGLCCERLGKFRQAAAYYKTCLRIGQSRTPTQQLLRVQSRLEKLSRKRVGFFGGIAKLFEPPEQRQLIDSADRMREETARAMTQIMREGKRLNGYQSLPGQGPKTPKLLGEGAEQKKKDRP